MYTEIPTYHERLAGLIDQLRDQGHLGLILVDASELARVEHDYGSKPFHQVLSKVSTLVGALQGKEVRQSDMLALNDRGGNAFLLFLSPKRGEQDRNPRIADFEAIRNRVDEGLNRRLSDLQSPYLREKRKVVVGYAVVFNNPLIMAERVVSRVVSEAWESVRIQKAQADFQARCRLQDVMLGDQISSVYQPIVDLLGKDGSIHGLEALSRGPRDTQQHMPMNMFETAKSADLTFELDRHCRRKALKTARDLPSPLRLFINVMPAAMYDPDFTGSALIRMLEGLGLSPERIVLEVSEQEAIQNYTLFVEALENFKQIGFSIAVDDIGAGYSGLETITRLEPRYLKFDMELVRDIDESKVKWEMARALKTVADKMDSKIIAEGIERDGERQACVDLGIDYGQGYLLAKPAPLDSFHLGPAAGNA